MGAGRHLRADQARHAVHEAQVAAHLEALVKGVDVAQVAARDDDPVRHSPVKLLADLDRGRLLALQAQAVHAVGQVDGRLGRHVLHAALWPQPSCAAVTSSAGTSSCCWPGRSATPPSRPARAAGRARASAPRRGTPACTPGAARAAAQARARAAANAGAGARRTRRAPPRRRDGPPRLRGMSKAPRKGSSQARWTAARAQTGSRCRRSPRARAPRRRGRVP